ncbi:AraC family transcriptional regulator [Chryseobacterium sp.]|uniref:AraC family transcriptional regulator n=1 Tax=Chryseobacterium sp. TaxID=1871047 RepID=UPI00333F3EDB
MIPSHHNQLGNASFRLLPLSVIHEKQTALHRDDHYMFIVQQKGNFIMEVDFKTIELKGASVCFVGPGQIHRYIYQENNKGWFLFAESGAVSEPYREILDMHQWIHQSVPIDEHDPVFDLLPLFEKIEKDKTLKNPSIEISLMEATIGIIASRISEAPLSQLQYGGQKYSITRQFKKYITEHFKTIKQVQQYAKLLHITPLYLNEAVKEVTGYPASFWIQHKTLLEARRLLFYTSMDVKQIAFELGYNDPIYFSRFFKKGTGMTALEFRAKNQDLSHHHH